MLTLGWKASPEQWSPEDLLEFAVEADRAGFDSIDVSDHFHPWAGAGQACYTWSWLGAAAARTSHVELTDDVESAIAPYRKYWRGTHIHSMYLRKIYTPAESEMNGQAVGDDTLKKGILISADPEAHARKAQQLIDAGFNRIYFNSASQDQARFIRDFAGEVLPVIRDHNPDMLRRPGGAPAEATSR